MFFKKKNLPKTNPMLQEMGKLKTELEAAYSVFENVTDPDLIDSSIYHLNSLQQRYRFLLRQIKSEEAKV